MVLTSVFGNLNASTATIADLTAETVIAVNITGSGSHTIGTLTLGSGSITDSSGQISFGSTNLITTGTFESGNMTCNGLLTLVSSPTSNVTLDQSGTWFRLISAGVGSGISLSTSAILPTDFAGTGTNNTIDVGSAAGRWKIGYFGTSASIGLTGATMTISPGTIIDTSGAISFGSSDLSTTGTISSGGHTAGSMTYGDTGLIYNNTGGAGVGTFYTTAAILPVDFNGALTDNIADLGSAANQWQRIYLGTSAIIAATLTLATGSISDTSGAITFGSTNLGTTGTIGAGTVAPAQTLDTAAGFIVGSALVSAGYQSAGVPGISIGATTFAKTQLRADNMATTYSVLIADIDATANASKHASIAFGVTENGASPAVSNTKIGARITCQASDQFAGYQSLVFSTSSNAGQTNGEWLGQSTLSGDGNLGIQTGIYDASLNLTGNYSPFYTLQVFNTLAAITPMAIATANAWIGGGTYPARGGTSYGIAIGCDTASGQSYLQSSSVAAAGTAVVGGHINLQPLSGNVAFGGTQTPARMIDVIGEIQAFVAVDSYETVLELINEQAGTGSSNIGFNVASSGETSVPKASFGFIRTSTQGVGDLIWCNDSATDTNPVALSNEVMRLTSAGYLGVLKTPLTPIDVNGTTRSTAFQIYTDANNSSQWTSTALYRTLATSPNGSGITFVNAAWYPTDGSGTTSDGVVDLGATGNKFNDIWAVNATIQTSDETMKTEIVPLSQSELDVADAISSDLCRYKLKSSVSKKNDQARYHIGAISQQVATRFREHNLDPDQYGLYCYNIYYRDEAGLSVDPNGIPYTEARDAYIVYVDGAGNTSDLDGNTYTKDSDGIIEYYDEKGETHKSYDGKPYTADSDGISYYIDVAGNMNDTDNKPYTKNSSGIVTYVDEKGSSVDTNGKAYTAESDGLISYIDELGSEVDDTGKPYTVDSDGIYHYEDVNGSTIDSDGNAYEADSDGIIIYTDRDGFTSGKNGKKYTAESDGIICYVDEYSSMVDKNGNDYQADSDGIIYYVDEAGSTTDKDGNLYTADQENVTASASGVTAIASGVTASASGVTAIPSGVTASGSGVTLKSSGVSRKSTGVKARILGVTAEKRPAVMKVTSQGLRYSELLVFLAAASASRVSTLESKYDALETRLASMENLLKTR